MSALSLRRLSLQLVVTVLSSVLIASALSMAPAAAKKVRPDFFGMHDARLRAGAFPQAPVGSVRLWDTGTAWRQIETSPGDFNFTALDRAVETARANGAKPMIVLGQTPRFHAKKRNAPGAYGPGATSMPKMRAWKRYVGKVAKRYKGKAEYQIWNEPNVINYWTGSPRQMAKLTKAADKQIRKKAGRRAKVIAPAFPLRLDSQHRWFTRYWSQRIGGKRVARFVDVAAVNLYPLADQEPEASMRLLKRAKRVLNRRGARRMPIWNTEINYGLRGGPPAKKISMDRQQAFVARTFLLNAAAGIDRVYWYRWDLKTIANTILTQSNNATPTAAGRTYAVVRGWLNRTKVKRCNEHRRGKLKGVYECKARKGKQVRRIYWKPRGKPQKIRTHRTTRKYERVNGNVTRERGRTRLKVGFSPIMVTSKR